MLLAPPGVLETVKTDFSGFLQNIDFITLEMLQFRIVMACIPIRTTSFSGFSVCLFYFLGQSVRPIFPILPAFSGAFAPIPTWVGDLYDRFFRFYLVLLRFRVFWVGSVIFLNFQNYIFLTMHLLDK